MNEKAVAYAYPASLRATQLGHGKAGRWFVEEVTDFRHVKILGDFETKAEAFAFAEALPMAYSRWSFVRDQS